jgi:DNA polymerase-3 subunit alpha
MSSPSFVHLRLHTEFSLKFGMLRIDELMEKLSQGGIPAAALTDCMNLFAVVKFYREAIAHGIKPLIACEIALQKSPEDPQLYSAILLCQNLSGYRHLTELISMGYEQGQHHGTVRIHWSWLQKHHEGLIVLSGARQGDIGALLLQDKLDLAKAACQEWMQIFPNRFYLEIQRVGHPDENRYNQNLIKIADELQLPLVATNAVCFLEQSDFDAHEARICIHQGKVLADPNRPKDFTPAQYCKSAQEMQELFKDLPQALQNTVEIAKRCNLELTLGKSFLPNFPTPQGEPVDEYLRTCSINGLEKRFQFLPQNIDHETYRQRLKHELDVIINMGFPGYFLIVADFIQWAKDNGVPVGPGRGSGAGSLVAYALGITDLDPLAYDLLFERFLNPERVSMPDFDVDFCMIGRDRVIDYVARRYGRDSVAQIITFGTMAAKAVVRDVGRVLGHPYGFVDKIAKLIPFEIGMTLANALSQEPELLKRYQDEEDVKDLLDLAQKLEGITRNAGKHAGGVVIAPSKLTDFTAVYCEEGSSQKVSQFDKDDVEAAGLVKFDFLGLRTLTIINDALKEIKKLNPEVSIDINHIPLDDKDTFTLLQSGQTTAVFQLESRGMQELIKRLKPDCFEDIVALVALFRPGPLQSGMVDDFIDRKQGRAQIVYPHPDLEPILKPTYGVILYQEQVMQIAQVLANYTLGAADLLRRAMGKKKPEEMAKQRSIFLEGAQARGVDPDVASQIFDLMEKFAGYGFNKSHSAAYALVSYQTAWLKCHYPAAFMAAVLSSDMDNTDKVVHMLKECRRMKLQVIKPSIEQGVYQFQVLNDTDINYGLGSIKGIGEAAIDLIVEERKANGFYQSLRDMCQRLDLRKINKRVFEALIKSGSLDSMASHRAYLWDTLEEAMKLGAKNWQNVQHGQHDLFSFFDDEEEVIDPNTVTPWALQQILQAEKETLGWYISGHPSDEIVQEFKDICVSLANLNLAQMKIIRVCGMVSEWRKMLTKRGKQIVIIGLTQGDSFIEMVAFPERLPEEMTRFTPGDLIFVEAEVSMDPVRQQPRTSVQKILSQEEARALYAQSLSIPMSKEQEAQFEDLKTLLELNAGKCPVIISYQNDEFAVDLKLSQDWRVEPSSQLLRGLRELLPQSQIDFKYGSKLI